MDTKEYTLYFCPWFEFKFIPFAGNDLIRYLEYDAIQHKLEYLDKHFEIEDCYDHL